MEAIHVLYLVATFSSSESKKANNSQLIISEVKQTPLSAVREEERPMTLERL